MSATSATIADAAKLDLAQLQESLEALRRGDFEKRLPTDGLAGRAGIVARTLNATMEMLQTFKAEQMRLADEIGTRGELGGTMEVFNATGGWLEMIDAMNRMSAGLTVELRRTSQAAAALAQGEKVYPLAGELIGGEVAALQQHVTALAGRAEAPST
jgi:hypothetical protein